MPDNLWCRILTNLCVLVSSVHHDITLNPNKFNMYYQDMRSLFRPTGAMLLMPLSHYRVVTLVVTRDPWWWNHLPGNPIFPMVFGATVLLLSCHVGSHHLFTVTWIFHKVSHCFQRSLTVRHCCSTDVQCFVRSAFGGDVSIADSVGSWRGHCLASMNFWWTRPISCNKH